MAASSLRKVLICGDFPDRRKCDKLKEKNVDVFFENEGLHSNDGNDELLITLLEAAAQVKSENRSQNIKWGIKQHAQSPDATAYSRPCYGYRKAKEGQLAVHDEEAGVVRMIFDLLHERCQHNRHKTGIGGERHQDPYRQRYLA